MKKIKRKVKKSEPTPPSPPSPPVEIQGLKGCAIVSGAQIVTAAMKISTDTAEEVRKVESAEGTKDEKCYGENPDAVSLETRPVENNGWTAESSQSKRERHQLEYENDEDNNEHISLLPRDPTTTHGPLGTPPTSPVEQLPQGSLETTSTICPGWDQNTSIPKEKEKGKSMPIPEIVDDSFLETWDMIIHRCQHCNRPFGTRTRLLDHLSVWHVPGSPNIETHQTSEILSELNGFEDIHVIAEGGDIVIQVKSPSGVDYWWVASQVLWTTSRVFRAMFGPDSSYQEAVKVRRSKILGFPPALVLLEDDDPKALGLVLAALHHRDDLLPDKIPFEQLVNIAAIIDKYELQCVLANKLSKLSEPPRALKNIQDEDWLFVSYVFGHAVTFTEVSTDLILCGALGTDGALVFSKGESTNCLSEFTPESIIKKLTETRAFHVEQLRKQIETIQAERSHIRGKGPQHVCQFSTSLSYSPRECEAMQLGHLIQSILEHQLDDNDTWPLLAPKLLMGSGTPHIRGPNIGFRSRIEVVGLPVKIRAP